MDYAARYSTEGLGDLGPVVTIALIGLFIAGLVAGRMRKKTVDRLPDMAMRNGWRYEASPAEVPERLRGRPFGEGFGRGVQNLLVGEHRGRSFMVLEYFYRPHVAKKNQQPQVYAVVAVDTPGECPLLDISRDGPGTGQPHHELAVDHVGFAKKFAVRTDDDAFAHDVLSPATMDWMTDDERARTFPVRFHGHTLLTWEPGMIDLGRLQPMLDYLCDHLDRAPANAWPARR